MLIVTNAIDRVYTKRPGIAYRTVIYGSPNCGHVKAGRYLAKDFQIVRLEAFLDAQLIQPGIIPHKRPWFTVHNTYA